MNYIEIQRNKDLRQAQLKLRPKGQEHKDWYTQETTEARKRALEAAHILRNQIVDHMKRGII